MNPLVTHATKDINVRNVHNDKFDVQKIAPLGLRPDLKTSVVPSDDVAAVKVILREYHAMKKETSMYICRLKDQLRQVFPQFLTVFSKVNGVTAMAVTPFTLEKTVRNCGNTCRSWSFRRQIYMEVSFFMAWYSRRITLTAATSSLGTTEVFRSGRRPSGAIFWTSNLSLWTLRTLMSLVAWVTRGFKM